MQLFLSTTNQMCFLLSLIIIGFVFSRRTKTAAGGYAILSKLENNVFIPALVLATFMNNFTIARIKVSTIYLFVGFIVISVTAPLAVLLSKLFSKDTYTKNIYTYSLAFSNFGFMGNAVVSALFPKVFMEYLIFVLPLHFFAYFWAIPNLLIPSENGQDTLKDKLKRMANPMLISMLIGMLIGIINPTLPSFVNSTITTLGNCMSPIAMLLTGMAIAQINLKETFKTVPIYIASLIRLVIIPIIAMLIICFLPMSYGLKLCVVCSVAMPFGLNTIVVPSAYGKDTSIASGMVLISHLLSCISIPLIFMLFNTLVS